MKRPICINEGCGKPCITSQGRIKNNKGYIRFRPYCSNCFNANRGRAKYRKGVKPIQKYKCSNLDGHLGFPCIIGKEGHKRIKLLKCSLQMFQLDHKDGNPNNNKKSNIQELCVMCHKHKSVRNNDYAPKKKKACKRSKLLVELFYRRPTLIKVQPVQSLHECNATEPWLERVS